MAKHPYEYTLNGDPIDLGDFYAVNDLGADEVNAIGALKAGEEYLFGGGAAQVFVLRSELSAVRA